MTVKNESECFLSFSHTFSESSIPAESCCRGLEDQQRWQRARRGWEPKWGIKCSFLNLLFCKIRTFSGKKYIFRFPKENAGNFPSFRFYNLKSQKERQSFAAHFVKISFFARIWEERNSGWGGWWWWEGEKKISSRRKRFDSNLLLLPKKNIYIAKSVRFESLMSIIDFFTSSSLFLFLGKK